MRLYKAVARFRRWNLFHRRKLFLQSSRGCGLSKLARVAISEQFPNIDCQHVIIMTASAPESASSIVCSPIVVDNVALCREHFRLVLRAEHFPSALPGQFVQIHPRQASCDYAIHDWSAGHDSAVILPEQAQAASGEQPFLPRAFSIGGLRRRDGGCEIDIIYRVVGIGTRWMASLKPGETIELLGPLGRPFDVPDAGKLCYLIAGGVGLPPLLWLAEHLRDRAINAVAFFGATTRDLIPMTLTGDADTTARSASPIAKQFSIVGAPAVISTDDGSFGFRGNVVRAMAEFHRASGRGAGDVVAYTCGPERMMQAAARYCIDAGIECHVCMERPMACGTGTCQSCIVTVRDGKSSPSRYALCCTEGPVFRADQIVWSD